MKFVSLLKKSSKLVKAESEEVVRQRLEELERLLDEEGSISYGEINYLQDHQEEIKKYFPNNPIIWEWAGIPEEEWNKKSSLKKKAGESGGWYVAPDEAEEKLQLWVDAVGVEKALDDLVGSLGYDQLSEHLAYIFRMNDFREGLSETDEDEDDEELYEVDAFLYETVEEAYRAYKRAIEEEPYNDHVLKKGEEEIEFYKGK